MSRCPVCNEPSQAVLALRARNLTAQQVLSAIHRYVVYGSAFDPSYLPHGVLHDVVLVDVLELRKRYERLVFKVRFEGHDDWVEGPLNVMELEDAEFLKHAREALAAISGVDPKEST